MEQRCCVLTSFCFAFVPKGYKVLHRPKAFEQLLAKSGDRIEEDYIFMAETDHLLLKPMPNW